MRSYRPYCAADPEPDVQVLGVVHEIEACRDGASAELRRQPCLEIVPAGRLPFARAEHTVDDRRSVSPEDEARVADCSTGYRQERQGNQACQRPPPSAALRHRRPTVLLGSRSYKARRAPVPHRRSPRPRRRGDCSRRPIVAKSRSEPVLPLGALDPDDERGELAPVAQPINGVDEPDISAAT